MTQRILLRLPSLSLTEANLQGLAERALASPDITPEQALGAILSHMEEVMLMAGEFAQGLRGEKRLVIHEDLSLTWIDP